MTRMSRAKVYLGDPAMAKVAALAQLLTADSGRRVTYGEAVERAVDIALDERAREGAAT